MESFDSIQGGSDAFTPSSLLRALSENTSAAIFVKDLEGRYLMMNRTCERLWGMPRSELLGRTDFEVLPAECAAAMRAHDVQVTGSRQTAEFEEQVDFPTGRRTYLCSKSPIFDADGECCGLCGVATDITEWERSNRELQRSRARLAELHRRKDEFLAVLAHELRNPLAPIVQAAELLSLSPHDDESRERTAAVVLRQARHMSRLIEDLMDAARLTRGRIQLQKQPVPLADVLERAKELTASSLARNEQRLEIELPEERCWLHGDPDRLAQVFGNLLDNAAKYSEGPGTVRVRAERRGHDAFVRVTDEGRGIEPERLAHVFEGFSQAGGVAPHDASQPGLGLGLMIVKQLVELHGGAITARSEGAGRGSEFEVRVPLDEAQADASRPAEPEPRAAEARRVLVVDDNEDAADLLAQMVRAKGHHVRACYRGEQALAEVRSYHPDVVILDIGLPDLDGLEVARRLRAEHGDGLQLIALSGYGQKHDRERSQQAGFAHHLVKPVAFHTLDPLLSPTS